MNNYYIKDGYEEKGPFSKTQLKLLKISKTTLLRQSTNKTWSHAETFDDLKSCFNANYSTKKIAIIIAVSLPILVLAIVGLSKLSTHDTYPEGSITDITTSIPPPPIDFKISTQEKKFLNELFKDCNISGEKKQLIKACNYLDPILRNNAVNIAGKSPGTYNLGQVCDLFDYCYLNWKYVNDPKTTEVIEMASNTISNGLNGDCDDFAVLLCSLILAIGGEARINYAYGDNGGHAFTEVNIGTTSIEEYLFARYPRSDGENSIWTRVDKQGNHWLNLDWFAKYPGGKYFAYNRGTTFYIIQQYCNNFTK